MIFDIFDKIFLYANFFQISTYIPEYYKHVENLFQLNVRYSNLIFLGVPLLGFRV